MLFRSRDEQGNYVSGNKGGTHIKLTNTVMWDLHAIKNASNPAIFDEELCELAFIHINNLYNYLSSLDEYVESFDILDYLEIRELMEVKQVLDGGEELLFSASTYSLDKMTFMPLPSQARNDCMTSILTDSDGKMKSYTITGETCGIAFMHKVNKVKDQNK